MIFCNLPVKRFITKANKTTRDEIERLIAGEPIEKPIRLELTYDEIDNTKQLTAFWNSIEEGKTTAIEQYLNRTLSNSISVFDTKAPENEKENSYHTLLVGLLTGNTDWVVRSNVEAGEGFADIIVEPEDPDAGIIFELKYSKEAIGLEKACEKAIEQIKSRRYSEYLKNDGRHDMMFYGIAFYKKRCKVVVEKLKEA